MKKDTNLLDAQDVRAEAATALTPNATNGEKIKALRTAQGMSMAELSRRAWLYSLYGQPQMMS